MHNNHISGTLYFARNQEVKYVEQFLRPVFSITRSKDVSWRPALEEVMRGDAERETVIGQSMILLEAACICQLSTERLQAAHRHWFYFQSA